MSKKRSLQKQICDVFAGITTLGVSRHAAKHTGSADRLIFSISTHNTYVDRVITAVKWIKTHRRPDLRELRDIHHADWIAYFADCEQRSLSGGGIRASLAAARKLEHAMRHHNWWAGDTDFIPDIEIHTPRSDARGGFSERQISTIFSQLAGDPLLAARIAYSTGLRLNEVYRLHSDDIDLVAGTVRVRRSSAKGGRERVVTRIHDHHVLRDALAQAQGHYVFKPNVARTIQDHVRATVIHAGAGGAGKNMHSFRASYAERLLHTLLAEGLTENDARRVLSHQLGHSRTNVTYRYVPRLT